jgi:hypothetical protein
MELQMTQEKKATLVYWATIALMVSVIARLTLLNPDLAFDVIVVLMAIGVAAALVLMVGTIKKTNRLTLCMAVYSFVGLFYWGAYLTEYYEEKAHGPIAVYSHPCEGVDPNEPIIVRQGETVTLVGMGSRFFCATSEATAQSIAH